MIVKRNIEHYIFIYYFIIRDVVKIIESNQKYKNCINVYKSYYFI